MSKSLLYQEAFGTSGKDILYLTEKRFPSNGSKITLTFDLDQTSRQFEIKNSSYFITETIPIVDIKSLLNLGVDLVPNVSCIFDTQEVAIGGGQISYWARTSALAAQRNIKNKRLAISRDLGFDKTGNFGRTVYLSVANLGASCGGGMPIECLAGIKTYNAEAYIQFLVPILQSPDNEQRELNLGGQYETWEKYLSGLRGRTENIDIIPIIFENTDNKIILSSPGFLQYSSEQINLFHSTPITNDMVRHFIKNTKNQQFMDPCPRFNAIGWSKVCLDREQLKIQAKDQLVHKLIGEFTSTMTDSPPIQLPDVQLILGNIIGKIKDQVEKEFGPRLPLIPEAVSTYSVDDVLRTVLDEIGVDEKVEKSFHAELKPILGDRIYSTLFSHGLKTTRICAEQLKSWIEEFHISLADLSTPLVNRKEELDRISNELRKVRTWLPFGKWRQVRKFEIWIEALRHYADLRIVFLIIEKIKYAFNYGDFVEALLIQLNEWNPEEHLPEIGDQTKRIPVGHIQLSGTFSSRRIVEREVNQKYSIFKHNVLAKLKNEDFSVIIIQKAVDQYSELYGSEIAHSIQTNLIWNGMVQEERDNLISKALALSAPKVRITPGASITTGLYVYSPNNPELTQVAEEIFSYAVKDKSADDSFQNTHNDDQNSIVIFQLAALHLDNWQSFKEWHSVLRTCDEGDDMRWRIAHPTPVAALTPRPQELVQDAERWLLPLSKTIDPKQIDMIREQISQRCEVKGYYNLLYSFFIERGAEFISLLPDDVQQKAKLRYINLKEIEL